MKTNLESLKLTEEQSKVVNQRLAALLTKTHLTFASRVDFDSQLKQLARSAYYQGLLDGYKAEKMRMRKIRRAT